MQMNDEKNRLSQDNQVLQGSQGYELCFPNVERSNCLKIYVIQNSVENAVERWNKLSTMG